MCTDFHIRKENFLGYGHFKIDWNCATRQRDVKLKIWTIFLVPPHLGSKRFCASWLLSRVRVSGGGIRDNNPDVKASTRSTWPQKGGRRILWTSDLCLFRHLDRTGPSLEDWSYFCFCFPCYFKVSGCWDPTDSATRKSSLGYHTIFAHSWRSFLHTQWKTWRP